MIQRSVFYVAFIAVLLSSNANGDTKAQQEFDAQLAKAKKVAQASLTVEIKTNATKEGQEPRESSKNKGLQFDRKRDIYVIAEEQGGMRNQIHATGKFFAVWTAKEDEIPNRMVKFYESAGERHNALMLRSAALVWMIDPLKGAPFLKANFDVTGTGGTAENRVIELAIKKEPKDKRLKSMVTDRGLKQTAELTFDADGLVTKAAVKQQMGDYSGEMTCTVAEKKLSAPATAFELPASVKEKVEAERAKKK